MVGDLGEVRVKVESNACPQESQRSSRELRESDWDRPQAKSKLAAAPRRSDKIDCPQVDESSACHQDGE